MKSVGVESGGRGDWIGESEGTSIYRRKVRFVINVMSNSWLVEHNIPRFVTITTQAQVRQWVVPKLPKTSQIAQNSDRGQYV
jgi:hypothetical protein